MNASSLALMSEKLHKVQENYTTEFSRQSRLRIKDGKGVRREDNIFTKD